MLPKLAAVFVFLKFVRDSVEGESGILTWRFLYSFCLEQDTVKTLINQGANRFTIGRNFNHQNLCGTDFRPFTDTIDTKRPSISPSQWLPGISYFARNVWELSRSSPYVPANATTQSKEGPEWLSPAS
jgi:hypothetical protein